MDGWSISALIWLLLAPIVMWSYQEWRLRHMPKQRRRRTQKAHLKDAPTADYKGP